MLSDGHCGKTTAFKRTQTLKCVLYVAVEQGWIDPVSYTHLDKLDAFGDFDDCMIYIAENYAWNANSDGAKFLMELLERKFA